MASFVYQARDRNGVLQTGSLDGASEDDVLEVLQRRGLIVTALSLKGDQAVQAARRRTARRLHGKANSDDKILFCQQLSVMLEAGIPLLKGLEVISAQVESRSLLMAIEQMREEIEAGRSFRDALTKHPRIFGPFWVNLVETGEASGHLAQSLTQLARYLESVRQIHRKAVTALTYPAVLVGVAILAITVLLLWIIPVFIKLFGSLNLELPLLTQVIIAMSQGVRRYWAVIVLGVMASSYALRRALRTEGGRWLVDRLLLKIPVFDRLFIQLQLAQFARGFSALLESGVPILYSLDIMEHSATNTVYGKAIGEVRDEVREGRAMAQAMERTGVFPAMTVQMVQVGEEIGALGKMLDRVANYYEDRVSAFIDRLTALFEPIAIMVMAVVIGTLVIAIFLPILTMSTSMRL